MCVCVCMHACVYEQCMYQALHDMVVWLVYTLTTVTPTFNLNSPNRCHPRNCNHWGRSQALCCHDDDCCDGGDCGSCICSIMTCGVLSSILYVHIASHNFIVLSFPYIFGDEEWQKPRCKMPYKGFVSL